MKSYEFEIGPIEQCRCRNVVGQHKISTSLIEFFEKMARCLNARLFLEHKVRTRMISSRNIAKMTTYPQFVNYLLCTYATDESKADTMIEITTFTQTQNKTPLQDSEELKAKALRCQDKYEEQDMNNFLNKRLEKSLKYA